MSDIGTRFIAAEAKNLQSQKLECKKVAFLLFTYVQDVVDIVNLSVLL